MTADMTITLRAHLGAWLDHADVDHPFLEYAGRTFTWGEAQRCAVRLGDIVDDLGLERPVRIGVVLLNQPGCAAAVVGLLGRGDVVVTFNGLQPLEKLAEEVERAGVQLLVVPAQRSGDLRRLAEVASAVALVDGMTVTLDAVRPGGCAADAPTGVAIEMLSSGTTGRPKRIPLTDAQLDSSLAAAGQLPRGPGDRARGAVIVNAPLVHIGGMYALLSAVFTGRLVVLQDRFDVEVWADAVQRHQMRASGIVPAAIRAVLDADIAPDRLQSLQVLTTGTAPCPVEIVEEMHRRHGIAVLATYGATEFAGAVAGWTLPLFEEWWTAKKGSAGRAFGGAGLRITDDDGRPVAVGTLGRLEVMTQAGGGDGTWVRTSDRARIDDDGFLWIEGRTDNVIIRGGFKVWPDKVQAVLEAHPSVREAAVVARADRRLGQVPVAAVELHDGNEVPTSREMLEHCRAALVPYEVPADVVVVASLPRTPSMKVSSVELHEMLDRLAERDR